VDLDSFGAALILGAVGGLGYFVWSTWREHRRVKRRMEALRQRIMESYRKQH
jgi:hypothetical protein